MKTKIYIWTAALALAMSMRLLSAGEWSLSEWLKSLNGKVQRTEQKRKGQLAAAAAVRGDKKQDAEAKKLYWKGKKGEEKPASVSELEDFKAALGLAEKGQTAEAEKSFQAFLEKYPASPMAEDAKQTLALLKETPPASAAAQPSEAQ
jgi:TolA-binding protein